MDRTGVIQGSVPDEVAAMLALKARGWGVKRNAREFGT